MLSATRSSGFGAVSQVAQARDAARRSKDPDFIACVKTGKPSGATRYLSCTEFFQDVYAGPILAELEQCKKTESAAQNGSTCLTVLRLIQHTPPNISILTELVDLGANPATAFYFTGANNDFIKALAQQAPASLDTAASGVVSFLSAIVNYDLRLPNDSSVFPEAISLLVRLLSSVTHPNMLNAAIVFLQHLSGIQPNDCRSEDHSAMWHCGASADAPNLALAALAKIKAFVPLQVPTIETSTDSPDPWAQDNPGSIDPLPPPDATQHAGLPASIQWCLANPTVCVQQIGMPIQECLTNMTACMYQIASRLPGGIPTPNAPTSNAPSAKRPPPITYPLPDSDNWVVPVLATTGIVALLGVLAAVASRPKREAFAGRRRRRR